MNYRHRYHAGNFADVMKHALLVQLLRGLQRKEKGFLYLDTHAGRGSYDLETAATGDSLARKAEWPDGIGRLWGRDEAALPAGLIDYLQLVQDFDRRSGNLEANPRMYPGSPWIARLLKRPVDRLALCEMHPAECSVLRADAVGAGISVQEVDGYAAIRALLPPLERRALVLVDPPFEDPAEFRFIIEALAEGLRRFATGIFAVWYPLTTRARADEFLGALRALGPPPTLACELTIAGANAAIKMKGCGLVVINPPWQFAREATAMLAFLATALAQAPGGEGRTDWIVPEA